MTGRKSTHGGVGTRLYRIWINMKARCNNPNREAYKNYGGRGIKVCVDWNSDFIAFRTWAYDNGYKEDLTIERTDNDLGYSSSNCKWIPRGKQTCNRRPLPSRSGYYGVKFVARNTQRPWVATLNKIHLGSFTSPEEANQEVQSKLQEKENESIT